MMKKYLVVLGVVVVVLGLLSGCGERVEETEVALAVTTDAVEEVGAGGSGIGVEEPGFHNFKAITLDGESVNQDIFADYDLTMINIWATFCGPCLREMPDLGEIHEEYKDKNFQIVGIVTDVLNNDGTLSEKQLATAREVVEKTGAHYLHLIPSYDLIMAKIKDVTSVPETIFVDKDGNLTGESYLGSRSKDDWIKIIDELLGETES